MLKFGESTHPVFRSTSPLSRGVLKSKGGGTLPIHHCADFETASLLMKTPTPFTDDPAQEDLLQKYQERVQRLSQQNGVIKFCTDAGFLTTVDVGQYFTTKDTEKFSQFTDSVACREYTLPRVEDSSEPKRLDSREQQNWARIGSYNLLPAK